MGTSTCTFTTSENQPFKEDLMVQHRDLQKPFVDLHDVQRCPFLHLPVDIRKPELVGPGRVKRKSSIQHNEPRHCRKVRGKHKCEQNSVPFNLFSFIN